MELMIDLETMGTRPDAAIVQIGAVGFERVNRGRVHNEKGFSRFVLLQDGAGTIDTSTVAWWLQQPGARRLGEKMEKEGVLLTAALDEFVKWPEEKLGVGWESIGGIWSHGASFDIPILQSAFAVCGREVPWRYNVTRCTRTLYELNGYPDVDRSGLIEHDGFEDAVYQALCVQACMPARR